MSEQSFWHRLRDARVVRVVITYAAVAWGAIQVLDILVQHFTLPRWFFPAGLALLAIGLPILLTTAWLQARMARADTRTMAPRSPRSSSTWFTWRRAIAGGVLAFTALAILGAGFVWSRNRGHELQPDVVAVMPFHAVGADVGLWSEGLVDLLSTALDGTGAYHASDPRAVLIRWGKEVGQTETLAEPDDAARVATQLAAGQMILGSVITTSPGEVRVSADLFNVRWLRKDASAAVEGPEDEMTGLVDELTVELLKSIWREGDVPEVRVSTVTTSSIPALRAYLEGEQAFRKARFTDAQQAFGRAVELDSTFAIAAHRLSFAYGWALGAFEEEHIANAELAARHTAGLPARDSLLITGHKRVDIDGDLGVMELYENLVRRYPEDYEAWYGYGEALYHLGDQVGYERDRVIDTMSRAYDLDPTIAPSLYHLIQSAYAQDELETARLWTDRYLAIDSTSANARAMALGAALRLGPPADSAQAAQALDTLDVEVLGQIFFDAPPGRSSLAYSELVGRATATSRFPPPERVWRLGRLGRQYMRHGQISNWQSVGREADRIAGREGGLFDLTRARLAGVLDPEAEARQERLMSRVSYPVEASYLSPLLARQGRYEEARKAVDYMEARADSLDDAGNVRGARTTRGLALLYAGEIAAAQEDTRTAVDELRRGLDLIPGNWNSTRNPYRYTLANLIQNSGDELEALRIYGSLYQSPELEALGYLKKAQLHERRGEREDALRYYGWFLELWGDADAHLQPQVQVARDAIARLGPLDG